MIPTASETKASSIPPPAGWGLSAIQNLSLAAQTCLSGMSAYATDFFVPFLISTFYFQRVESERVYTSLPTETLDSYSDLFDFNLELANRSIKSALDILGSYGQNETEAFLSALYKSITSCDNRYMDEYARQRLKLMENVVYGYPQAIEDIGPEYGFHFERGEHKLIDETDRFYVHQVAPSEKGITIRPNAKPILIIPPYVLGANILCFLPGEKRSYVHCYANQGIPTYIRTLKKIENSVPLQVMTAEDDARDTRRFCETIFKKHGKAVTLNGYCQGGFNALCDLISGELDGLVDAFITCVAPMDGTRSKGLAHFLKRLPKRFNDLAYGAKKLPNGNIVADGKLMGWVYRLKSIATEQPLASFVNDMMLVSSSGKSEVKFTKMAAALNNWLVNERSDLPMEITKMSFASYNTPITKDGVLPVKLFGRELNLKRIKEKKIPWLICYGVHDNLVEPETALAPLDHVQAEVTPFPKGHVAIATSWSAPNSACALHTRFGEGNWRGPVRFHMDLDEAMDTKKSKVESTAPITIEKTKKPPTQKEAAPDVNATAEKEDSSKNLKSAPIVEPAKTFSPEKEASNAAETEEISAVEMASENLTQPENISAQKTAMEPDEKKTKRSIGASSPKKKGGGRKTEMTTSGSGPRPAKHTSGKNKGTKGSLRNAPESKSKPISTRSLKKDKKMETSSKQNGLVVKN